MKTNKFYIPSLDEILTLGRGLSGAEGEGGYLATVDAIESGAGGGQTIDGQSFESIWTDLNRRLALFNKNANRMVSLLTFPVDRAQDRVAVPWMPEFEEATEFGRPAKVRFQTIFRGFPLAHFDLGYGFTQEYIDIARAGEIRAIQVQAESAYWGLQMRTAMNALFDDDPPASLEGVAVKALYNADGEVPPNYRRITFDGTHTHYLTSNGASFDAADLAVIEDHLVHHGYGDSSLGGAGGTIFLHVNRANLAVVRGLTEFVPAASATVPVIVDGQVIGMQRSGDFGMSPEGYVGQMVVVQNNEIPVGYLLATVSGGAFNDQNVVGMRRHDNPSARGLRLIEGNNRRYPLIDSVYDCYMGAGIRHRGAAVVMQIVTGTTYTPPTI